MLKVGDQLPEYIGVTPEGDTLKLSSFSNEEKIVLVNFWAAWCPDCIKHNPELAELYQKYNGTKYGERDFEIVSISLDQDTALWKKRILEQNLVWKNHLTDGGSWKSEQLKKFNIHSIPGNYLVDHTGKIIGVDVGLADFDAVLKKYYVR